MIIAVAALIVGFVLLVCSSEKIVWVASDLSVRFRVPPLIVGVVILGFATSMPEILVSTIAALKQKSSLALGSAFGSSIANIGMIMGASLLLFILPISQKVFRYQVVILTIAVLVVGFVLSDLLISRLEACAMIVFFVVALLLNIRDSRASPAVVPVGDDQPLSDTTQTKLSKVLGWMLLSTCILLASAEMVVWGAIRAASFMGVSDLIIGLTVVAVGTSLPEMAASLSAARRGKYAFAIGNVLGSNLFNCLLVVGAAALIHPIHLTKDQVYLSGFPVMLVLTISLFLVGIGKHKGENYHRWLGGAMMVIYLVYIGSLIVHSLANNG